MNTDTGFNLTAKSLPFGKPSSTTMSLYQVLSTPLERIPTLPSLHVEPLSQLSILVGFSFAAFILSGSLPNSLFLFFNLFF